MFVSGGVCAGEGKKYAIARGFDVKAFLKFISNAGQFVGGAMMNVPGVKVITACIPETYCFYSNYDDPDRNVKCSMYIIKCIYKQLANIGTCLYDLAGDTAIDLHYNGLNFHNYDHVTLLWDVLICAGVDEWTMNYLKDMIQS
ncbi:uncharacterized protein LOC134721880 isoform X1 [Mytilus trossulus]|uniref:uncharacterized protein LOC134721880 isoform X1 n=1 Tax=Mytilus trossulus TaxID=6551 RepID=UPI0030068661